MSEHRGGRGTDAAAAMSNGSRSDQVTLTDTARRLSDVVQTASAQPAVDSQRVEQIRAAIQEGRYEVNAERVAEKLMNTEKLL